MNNFNVEAKIADWGRSFSVRTLIVLVAVLVVSAVLGYLAWDNRDAEYEQMTHDQIDELGKQLRAKRDSLRHNHKPAPASVTDPLFGKPYKELCRYVGQDKEICR